MMAGCQFFLPPLAYVKRILLPKAEEVMATITSKKIEGSVFPDTTSGACVIYVTEGRKVV